MKNIVQLGTIANIYSGGTPSRTKPVYWGGNIPWIKTTQIQNCYISESDVDECITEEGLRMSSAKIVPKGTILMAMYGQGKTRGQVAMLNLDAAINQACAAIELKKNVFCNFIFQQLLYKYKSIRGLSNAGSQENLSAGLIKEIDIILPSLPEQKGIADLLSTWDEVIEKAERLIAAKEKRFKWLLNELINKRASASDAKKWGWRREKLGAVADIQTGNRDNQNKTKNGKYPFFVRSQSIERIDSYSFDGEAILIPGEGKISEVIHYIKGKFNYHQRVYKISDFINEFNGKFLFYYLKRFFPVQARRHSVKATADSLRLPAFTEMEIYVPPRAEQIQIVKVLNTAQLEINLMQKIADKYKDQKRGLMQKLLTGKWRVRMDDGVP